MHAAIGLLLSRNEKVRTEARWIVTSALLSGTSERATFFVRCGCIAPLVRCLRFDAANDRDLVRDLEGAQLRMDGALCVPSSPLCAAAIAAAIEQSGATANAGDQSVNSVANVRVVRRIVTRLHELPPSSNNDATQVCIEAGIVQEIRWLQGGLRSL